MTPERDLNRVCACGCERGIGYLPTHAKYHPVCKVEIDRKRQADLARDRPKRVRRKRETIKSASPWSNFVQQDPHNRHRQKTLCKICFGMPWCRSSNRFGESGPSLLGVADESGVRCRGCGEAYSPEPPPERVSVLGSSAGLAVREGKLHGMQHVATGKPKSKDR